MVFVVLADGHRGEGVRLEGDAVVDVGGGELLDATGDFLLVAGECSSEDVDVAGDAACAELGEQQAIATVIAEKLSSAIALGDLNTRDRDYADLYQLISRHKLDGNELSTALVNTANHRGIRLRPLSEAISDLPTRRQASYTAWRRRQGTSAESHPDSFAELVATVTTFADPLADDSVRDFTWNPETKAWEAA